MKVLGLFFLIVIVSVFSVVVSVGLQAQTQFLAQHSAAGFLQEG